MILVVEAIMLEVVADCCNEGAGQIKGSEIRKNSHSACKNDRRHLHDIERVNFIVIGNPKRCIPVEDLLEEIIKIFKLKTDDLGQKSFVGYIFE